MQTFNTVVKVDARKLARAGELPAVPAGTGKRCEGFGWEILNDRSKELDRQPEEERVFRRRKKRAVLVDSVEGQWERRDDVFPVFIFGIAVHWYHKSQDITA